ncbi:hypothetical protein PC114_g10629 [Phytophthora cactorum]|uniref:Uncharacterized protein n=1 Tax=Phytophthora cactorum TaxID=29920 RepID=A0A8T1CJ51_9STRA|nr:hypothetical protein PC114_g10629 [Phytophthora cactorum]KAG2922645.1 hypothetical protein PC115_g9185 [Phytophthora cactorum]KAG3022913.1 hypothetical protein PC120_g7870 [Phytophthora cactorum]KAG3087545.1 hypothetical protein PC122_g8781 [Phytophthora cactorum]KAG3181004.1 hypothetical protein PC128_g15348 [Phytophthora cactorum]
MECAANPCILAKPRVGQMHSPFDNSGMTRGDRSFPTRYSSPRPTPTALPRRRPLPGGNFDANMNAMPWNDLNARIPPPMTNAAYPAPVMPYKADSKQLHSATSTSGDDSSAEDAKTSSKRLKTTKKGSEPKQAKSPRKERKPTHKLRKEQKMELLSQIKQLQDQLDSLKSQAIVSNTLHVKKHTQAPVMNTILRDAVQSRQSTLADVQGFISGYVQQQHDISPINTFIKLGMDRVQRHRELVAMKHAKLQTTHEFLLRRSRGLEPGRQYCEEERFETSRGDYCAVQFAVAHFRGATSVRAVFDAALFQIANVEMSMSEVLGNITIREDDDNGDDKNVTQLRLVTSTGSAPMAPPLETNSLQFNEFHEATTSGGPNGTATSEFGIIMADFVDEDELYPYRAHERMRKDVTAALLLTRLPKEEHRHIHREGDVRTRCSDDGELVVKSAKEIVSRARGTLVDFSLVLEQVSFALELVLVENSLVSAYVGISLVLKFEHVRFSLERT